MYSAEDFQREDQRRELARQFSLEDKRRQQINEPKGMMDTLNSNPFVKSFAENTQFIRGFGDTATNAVKAVPSWMSGLMGKAAGLDKNPIPYNPIQTGQGTAYDIGKYGPGVGAGIALASESIPLGIASSAFGTSIMNPETPLESLIEGAMTGIGGEVLGLGAKYGLKGAGKAKEYAQEKLSREGKFHDVTKSIQDYLSNAKIEAKEEYFKPFMKEHGMKNISESGKEKLGLWYEETKDFLSPKVKKLYRKFLKEPNVQNAFSVQSQAGTSVRGAKNKGIITQHDIEAADILKEELLDSIRDTVNSNTPNNLIGKGRLPSEKLDQGRAYWAKNVAPIENNDTFRDISVGNTFDLTPNKFSEEVQRATQGKFPELESGHKVARLGQEMKEQLARSEAYKDILKVLPTILAGIGGGYSGGPISGLGAGAATAALSHYSPKLKGLMDEEIARQLAKKMPGIKEVARKSKGAIVGAATLHPKEKEESK